MSSESVGTIVMNTLIGGHHTIDKNRWILSLVLNPKTKHCFLVLEGVDNTGNRVAKEAHLGHKRIDATNFDDTKCGIYYSDATPAKLSRVSSTFIYKSWPILSKDIHILESKIRDDKAKADSANGTPYSKVMTLGDSWTGIIGDTLDTFYLTDLKDSAIESTHRSLDTNSSISDASHASFIASLDNNPDKENCVSWAVKTAKVVPGVDLKEGSFSKYIVISPLQIVADRSPIAESEGCRIM